MTARFSNVNATLNREHSRVLIEHARLVMERSASSATQHVVRATVLAGKLRVDGRQERPDVTAQDLQFLDAIVNRPRDLDRPHSIHSEVTRETLAQGIGQLRELAAAFVPPNPPAIEKPS